MELFDEKTREAIKQKMREVKQQHPYWTDEKVRYVVMNDFPFPNKDDGWR